MVWRYLSIANPRSYPTWDRVQRSYAFDATSFARRSVHNLYSHVIKLLQKDSSKRDNWRQEVPQALVQELKEFCGDVWVRYDDLTLSSSFPNSSSSSPNSSSKLSPKFLSSSDMNEVDRLNTCYKFCQLVDMDSLPVRILPDSHHARANGHSAPLYLSCIIRQTCHYVCVKLLRVKTFST